jgi:chitodextrinase
MGMLPFDPNNPRGMPPGMPPFPPGQGAIPPGYVPTVTVVVPPQGSVGLNWLPTPNAQSYRIYQTLASQPLNFSVVQTVNQTPGQLATNAVVAGLQPGNTYFFQVRAVDPSGNEAPAPTTAMVGPSPNAGIPGPGVGTPSMLTVGGTTPTSIVLNWSPIPGARSYVVLQSSNPAGPFLPSIMSQMTPSGATITGLQPNTMYFFQLMAVDALGNQSPASGAVTLMTAPLAAGTSTGLTISNLTSTTASLTWAAVPGAISYQVLQGFSPNGPWMPAAVVNPTSNGAMVTGLNPGSLYYFEIIALDQMGMQISATTPATASTLSTSAPIGGQTLAPPSQLVTLSTTGSTVTLQWAASPGATNYMILQSTTGAGPFNPAAVSSVSGTSATITGLNPNSTYFYQVVAMDPFGHQSGPSNLTTAMTTSSVATLR